MGNEAQMDVDKDVTVFLRKTRSEAPDSLKEFFTKFEELYDRKCVGRVSPDSFHGSLTISRRMNQVMAPTDRATREIRRGARGEPLLGARL
jgi:hypothetical protein